MTILCVHPDRAVDPLTVDVLRAVDALARELQIPYFVVGAMARDILLWNVRGIDAVKFTRDVDFAVAVENWSQFSDMKSQLVATGRFNAAEQAHHLRYHALPGTNGYPLDIIPFRGAEQPGNKIYWPPEFAEKMNVVGYEETLAAAVEVQIEPDFTARVASLPGLTLLKIFAWDDRGHANPKDARDLLTVLRNYAGAEHARLYEDDELRKAVDYDDDRAGARLLGCDVRRIAFPATLEQLLHLLDDRRQVERLATHMSGGLTALENKQDLADRLLHEFRIGLGGS